MKRSQIVFFVVFCVGAAVISTRIAYRAAKPTSPKPSPLFARDGGIPSTTVPVEPKNQMSVEPVEPEWAAKLRAKAAEKGLQWRVVCKIYDDPDAQYLAWAQPPENEGKNYIEDGATPEWIVEGRTRKEAALNLLAALNHPPNIHPEHRPPKETSKHRCEPRIGGGPNHQAEYADNRKCEDCGTN
jgi:hypothetical protein